ncbi:MAG: TRAP transporter small permease [Methylobacteriaceae bacterium]|nr:TRAP transporter small permease [Methylobacteriaceae bacterium]MBV9705618.1 TRAP transporter small permease [Methylobacteriaceae bacterium]
MSGAQVQPDWLVLDQKRHLKWRAFDPLEKGLMILCGVLLAGFVTTVICDITTRTIGRPWLWLQEVTSVLFVYEIFVGAAVAVRRNDHLLLTAITEALRPAWRQVFETMQRLVIGAVGLAMVYFGYLNFLNGFGSFRMPSLTPIAYWYAAIPLSGVFVFLFALEQLVNGWSNGFAGEARTLQAGRAP